MSKLDIAIVACLLFIVGTGGYVYFTLYPPSIHQLLSWAPSEPTTKGTTTKIKPQKKPVNTFVTTAPSNNDDDTLFNRMAADPNAKKVEMKDVIGSNTSGTAYFLRENGKLFVSAQANMPNAPAGQYFQAWLMKETPRRYYVPLGKLKSGGEGRFLTNTALDTDYPDFNIIIITLEKNEDKLPERFVMQGSL